jgi:hypothetical protein
MTNLRHDRGTALVEFAFVAPLLLVLVFGTIEFGKFFHFWIDETQLAAAGARWAVVDKDASTLRCPDGSTPSSLQFFIRCQSATPELRSGAPDPSKYGASPMRVCIILQNGSASTVGDWVRVETETQYRWLSFLATELKFALPTTTIKGAATMRLEKKPAKVTAGCT